MLSARLHDRKVILKVKNLRKARISSIGTYVPDTIMTNADFEAILETSDEWITSRTGIKKRHIVSKDAPVPASHLGKFAGQKALKRADCAPKQVDAIICATFTPDSFFPSTACRMQELLGCTNAFAFDISAACTGFVYGITLANTLVATGQCEKVLVVGAEVISRTLDWTDRSTCILFGDGAGAVLVEVSDSEVRGIGNSCLKSDGSLGDILTLPCYGESCTMKMKGNEVFKHAVRMMSEVSHEALEASGVLVSDIDFFIPHQANIRIINSVAKQLAIPQEKVVINVAEYGNTSSASIPLALDGIWTEGKVGNGTKVLFSALGGGVTAGSVYVQF